MRSILNASMDVYVELNQHDGHQFMQLVPGTALQLQVHGSSSGSCDVIGT